MRLRVRVKIPPPSPFLLGYGAILGHSQYRRYPERVQRARKLHPETFHERAEPEGVGSIPARPCGATSSMSSLLIGRVGRYDVQIRAYTVLIDDFLTRTGVS